jgi:hypothetical protein
MKKDALKGGGTRLGASNLSLTLQCLCAGAAVACFGALALTSSGTTVRLFDGALALLLGFVVWQTINRGRSRHEHDADTLKIRSFQVSKNLPVSAIAGVGLIQTQLRSVVASYNAWQPFVWGSDGVGFRLRGITVLERGRSNQQLLQTRSGRAAQEIFEWVADRQGPSGLLLQHRVQIQAIRPPSIIELLPGAHESHPNFRRWNPGSHWEGVNT